MTALRVKVLEAVSEVSREAWNHVVGPAAPPVARHEWLDAMEQSGSAVPERGWAPQHLALYRGPTLIGCVSAYLKFHSMGEYVYDFGWANAAQAMGVEYYPKLLIGAPLSPLTCQRFHAAPGESLDEVRRVLLEAARALAKERGCSSVHVLFPPEAEADWLVAEGLIHRSSLQYHWKNPGYRSYDDYLSRFDAKRRHQLKRERGAAATQGLTLETVRSADIGPEHAALAWRFYEATASRHAWGPVQLTADFFDRAFATVRDQVELVVARKGRQVVAGAFNLHTAQRLYGRYWGCFEEHPFLHFNVCLYHSIDDCIARGLQVFEPGAGGEHKVSRGFEPTRIHSAHLLFNARLSRAVADFCRREDQQVEGVVQEAAQLAGLRPWVSPSSGAPGV
jgi:hypothetical protein